MKRFFGTALLVLLLITCTSCGGDGGDTSVTAEDFDTALQADSSAGDDGSDNPEDAEGGLVVIAAPDHYFGAETERKDDTIHFLTNENPMDAVHHYVELLQSDYDMILEDSYEDEECGKWILCAGRNPEASVSISLDRTGNGSWEIFCDLSVCVFTADAEVWEWPAETTSASASAPTPAPESTSAPVPTPTPAPETGSVSAPAPQPADNDPSVLPDFLEHDSSEKFALSSSSIGKVVYKAASADTADVVRQYVQLLLDRGYTVVYSKDKVYTQSSSAGVYLVWDLKHTDVDAGAVGKDSDGQIKIILNTYEKRKSSTFSIAFSDGITMEGFNATSGSSGSDDDFFATCPACHGSKKCTHCNGTDIKKKFQAGIGWVEQDCTFCSFGKCPTCGGTGKP